MRVEWGVEHVEEEMYFPGHESMGQLGVNLLFNFEHAKTPVEVKNNAF